MSEERHVQDYDAALARLEDVILDLPPGRALPPLEELIDRAELPPGFLREDERARKVVLEAVAGRPLGDIHTVVQLRTEVELLTLEVEVLNDRVTSGDERTAVDAAVRLREVRARLSEIRSQL